MVDDLAGKVVAAHIERTEPFAAAHDLAGQFADQNQPRNVVENDIWRGPDGPATSVRTPDMRSARRGAECGVSARQNTKVAQASQPGPPLLATGSNNLSLVGHGSRCWDVKENAAASRLTHTSMCSNLLALAPDPSQRATLKRMRSALDGEDTAKRPSLSPPTEQPEGYRRSANLPDDKRQRIVTLYREGMGVKKIAAEVGVHRSTVTATLRRHGIAAPPPTMSPTMIEQAVRLHAQGLSHVKIGLRLGVSRTVVGRNLLAVERGISQPA
jgi:transposase-like protein